MGDLRTPRNETTRWVLIRDVAVFQLKVGVDALRDLALVPVSLVAGILDLVRGGERPGRLFYDVLDIGRRTEEWINLFGDHDRDRPGLTRDEPAAGRESVDSIAARLEHLIIEQYERGGMTATAKNAIDRSLDALSAAKRRDRELPSGEESDS